MEVDNRLLLLWKKRDENEAVAKAQNGGAHARLRASAPNSHFFNPVLAIQQHSS